MGFSIGGLGGFSIRGKGLLGPLGGRNQIEPASIADAPEETASACEFSSGSGFPACKVKGRGLAGSANYLPGDS